MAVSDADGTIYYRYIYDTYGELSDITTDDGVSLKSSEQLTEYRLAELADATDIDYLYNGQYGVETDQNGLYYMRARYYDQDIKRFINRDIVSGDISSSQSLNRYCYVQGNPVSLTDPFGLCPDPNSNFKNFCKFLYEADWSAIGHAALDVAGIFWEGADVINAVWYALEGNTEMAIASAIFAIPGLGIGVGNLMMKSEKLAGAGKAVKAISKMTQSGMGIAAGINMAQIGFTNMLNSIEAGEFSTGDLAMMIGGIAISAISGKGLISSGKDFASIFDDAGKTSKAGKGYLTDSDVNSMPIGGNQAKVSSLSPGSSRAVTGACFVAGTLIKTDDGYQTVEDIAVGDYVYAKNTETGEVGYKQVVRLFRKQVTELVHLQIGNEEIDTTTNHPFWVDGYGFKEAGELAEGDLVENDEGILLPVISVSREQLTEPVAVYNFEVEDWHTYYVSEEEVLVHNDCMMKPGDVRGKISYGELDSLGRTTGAEAVITKDMIGTGSSASVSIKPAGFGGQVQGHARGHLLGKQLGGSGRDPRNLATIYQNPVNHPVMSSIEAKVRKAVEEGQVVHYRVTPIYDGDDLIPRGFTIRARGDDGLDIYETILNRK